MRFLTELDFDETPKKAILSETGAAYFNVFLYQLNTSISQ